MKTLAFLLLFTQIINTGSSRKVFTVASCTPPTMTYRWQVADPGTLCGSGVACTNGAGIQSIPSSATSNTASQSAGTGQQPVYTTGAINGLPAALFNGATNQRSLTIGSPIAVGSGTLTWYAVLEPTSAASASLGIIGAPTQAGGSGSFEWRITGSSNNQQTLSEQRAGIGLGTATIATSHFSAIVTTYNFSTGAWALYTCASGTCTSDGSGTATATWGLTIRELGAASGDTAWFNGYIAEWGYLNSISTTGIASYVNCQYGI
jgi:hypothetical protein